MTPNWSFRAHLERLLAGDPLTPEEFDDIRPLILQAEDGGVDVSAFRVLDDAIETVPRSYRVNLVAPEYYQSRRAFALEEMSASAVPLRQLASNVMAYFHLDPRLAFSSDGQLLVPGVHDGTLKSFEVSDTGELILETRSPDMTRVIRFTFSGDGAPCALSCGTLLPAIIGRGMWIKAPYDRWDLDDGAGEILKCLDEGVLEMSPNWIFLLDPIFGNGLAIVGRGELTTLLKIDICASPALRP